jgi:murein DD-endopeptidase MepM/ murein hydrolase activator NlpD
MRKSISIFLSFALLGLGTVSAKANDFTYVFPVADCTVKYAHSHHDYPATDILAKKGCAFVAPIDGVVEDVNFKDVWSSKTNRGQDRGGLSVSIIGIDGVRYYGSHLSSVAEGIVPGVSVIAGDILGKVGDTGSARGTSPHLHFGISWPTKAGDWKIRRGALYPWPYLDAWKVGENLSPVNAVAKKKKSLG